MCGTTEKNFRVKFTKKELRKNKKYKRTPREQVTD